MNKYKCIQDYLATCSCLKETNQVCLNLLLFSQIHSLNVIFTFYLFYPTSHLGPKKNLQILFVTYIVIHSMICDLI